MSRAPKPNPAWRYSPPRSGWIQVDRFAPDGTYLHTDRVQVVEVDACAIASLLPSPPMACPPPRQSTPNPRSRR